MTPEPTGGAAPVPCVGAVVHDASGRLLVVRRGRPPAAGRWSVPGGRVAPGEDEVAAVLREVREETGLEVAVGRLLGRVVVPDDPDGPAPAGYAVADYACTPVGGTLRAGDDAADARWVDAAALAALPLVDGLRDALARWDALPG